MPNFVWNKLHNNCYLYGPECLRAILLKFDMRKYMRMIDFILRLNTFEKGTRRSLQIGYNFELSKLSRYSALKQRQVLCCCKSCPDSVWWTRLIRICMSMNWFQTYLYDGYIVRFRSKCPVCLPSTDIRRFL